MEDVKIVRLLPEEWQTLRELRLRAVKEETFAFGKTYEEELKETENDWRKKLENSVYMIAKMGDKPVGMLCGVQEKGIKQQHVATIYGVYVAPEARGKHVATLLIEAIMQELRSRGVMKVCLYVTRNQEAAISLYKKLGFREVGVNEKEMLINGEYVDSFAMEKFIQ